MMNPLQDRLIAVVLRQIQVGPPPRVRLRRGDISGEKRVEVRFIERAIGPGVIERAGAGLHVVNVAVGQTAFVQKAAVLFLGHQVQSPEIAAELIGRRRLDHIIDDAKLDVGRERSVHSRQAKQFVADRFKHPLLAAVQIVALLNVRPEAQPSPERFVFAAPVVARLEIVSAIETEFPRVFGHGITPHAPAHSVAHVVVNLAVVNHRPQPQIIVAAILVVRGAGIPARGRENGIAFGEQLENRKPVHFI